jgi:hypothetical protein
LAWTSQKTTAQAALLLLRVCLLQPSHDRYWAIAEQRARLQSQSIATTVSAGFAILALYRRATVYDYKTANISFQD